MYGLELEIEHPISMKIKVMIKRSGIIRDLSYTVFVTVLNQITIFLISKFLWILRIKISEIFSSSEDNNQNGKIFAISKEEEIWHLFIHANSKRYFRYF